MVEYFLAHSSELDHIYHWEVASLEDFKNQVRSRAASADHLNRLYWADMARSIEAYGVVISWRATELLQAVIALLSAKNILAPAVLARSLLELAASVIVNGNIIRKSVQQAVGHPDGTIVASEGLEEVVYRMIHGTRLPTDADVPKQKNVLSYIDAISKHEDAAELRATYDYLCEIAHPNVVGNARFWASISRVPGALSETLTMERSSDALATREILAKTLWAVGWSSVCIRNGSEMCTTAARDLFNRWPPLPD